MLFLMNNAAGPDALAQAVGRERVLIGFPSSAGYRDSHVMHVLTGQPGDEMELPIGEIDGRASNSKPGMRASAAAAWRTRLAGVPEVAGGREDMTRTSREG